MPTYFFHTEDGVYIRDKDGTTLADIEAAKAEAAIFLAERLRDEPHLLWRTGNWRITVSDDTGLTLFILDLSAIFSAAFPASAVPKNQLSSRA